MTKEEFQADVALLRARKAELEATVADPTLEAAERETASTELATVLDELRPIKLLQRRQAENQS